MANAMVPLLVMIVLGGSVCALNFGRQGQGSPAAITIAIMIGASLLCLSLPYLGQSSFEEGELMLLLSLEGVAGVAISAVVGILTLLAWQHGQADIDDETVL